VTIFEEEGKRLGEIGFNTLKHNVRGKIGQKKHRQRDLNALMNAFKKEQKKKKMTKTTTTAEEERVLMDDGERKREEAKEVKVFAFDGKRTLFGAAAENKTNDTT